MKRIDGAIEFYLFNRDYLQKFMAGIHLNYENHLEFIFHYLWPLENIFMTFQIFLGQFWAVILDRILFSLRELTDRQNMLQKV